MADLNPNLTINVHDIFRDKFADFRYTRRYEVVRVQTDVFPKLIFIKDLENNVVQKRSPEEMNLFFIKENNFPSS